MNKNNLQVLEPLQPYFKSRKGISQTSLCHGILNKICHWFCFTYKSFNARKQKNTTNELCMRTTFQRVLNQDFFLFASSGFLKRPVSLKYWLIRPCFYKEATCKSSTIKGLLYIAKAVPSKDYFMHLTPKNARKGRWVISPDYCASHPWHFCAVGDVVAQRYDVLRDWLWDVCHMAGVRWGSRCEEFCSKEGLHYCLEWSARKLS